MDNKYSVYRKIRYDRTYRPLGKMSLWRVIAGILLLVLVLFLSGAVSDSFAARGHFRTAERLLLSRTWMEKYRGEVLRYIDAGVLYEEGDFEAAYEAFRQIEGEEAAERMASLAAMKAAGQKYEAWDTDSACALAFAVDPARFTPEETREYRELCTNLMFRCALSSDSHTAEQTEALQKILEATEDAA